MGASTAAQACRVAVAVRSDRIAASARRRCFGSAREIARAGKLDRHAGDHDRGSGSANPARRGIYRASPQKHSPECICRSRARPAHPAASRPTRPCSTERRVPELLGRTLGQQYLMVHRCVAMAEVEDFAAALRRDRLTRVVGGRAHRVAAWTYSAHRRRSSRTRGAVSPKPQSAAAFLPLARSRCPPLAFPRSIAWGDNHAADTISRRLRECQCGPKIIAVRGIRKRSLRRHWANRQFTSKRACHLSLNAIL